MRTNPMPQGQGTMSLYRADRSDMDTLMGVRAPRHRLSARIENCTRGIRSPIQPLDAGTVAKTLVKVVQMTMCIFVMDAVLPLTLLPVVGVLLSPPCVSTWGDQTNASLGYVTDTWYFSDDHSRGGDWRCCLRSWFASDNILPCERYARPMNEHESPVLRLKDQIAVQEPTMHGFVTRYLLDLEIIFESQWIFCRGISENSENNIILHDWYLPGQLSRHESWKLSNFDPPPASELMPTNICAEQAAQEESSSLAGYVTTAASIATSLMTYALNATMIEPDQEERPDSFRLKMIGICVLGGAATLCASAWAVFYAIKKRSRATDLATATESVSLKTLQETA